MAENARDISEQTKSTVDKEQRLKSLKDRQNEERQKKLEEIKAQAFAAQRFKEQKEFERRKRLEDLKCKEDVRRQQVEERKKAIVQAEQDRLVYILKRNQERDVRLEMKKKNEKSNIVFAFGSSTPRMLDPTDMNSSFWGHRRATSIQNITTATSATLTRRQSERDLDIGSKKRATSAGGLERAAESSTPLTPAGCVSGYVGRRRTDLMPTIPNRDSPFAASRKSLNHSPGRAYSMTRLDQLAQPRKRADLPAVIENNFPFRPLSSPRQSSVTRSMSHLAVSRPNTEKSQTRKSLSKADSRSMHQLCDGPAIAPRTTRATQLRQQKLLLSSSNCSDASSRPSSSLSQQSTTSVTSSVSVRHRPLTTPRRQRPASIAITGITHDPTKIIDAKKGDSKPPLPKTRKSITKEKTKSKTSPIDTPKSLASPVTNAPTTIVNNEPANLVPKEPPEAPPESVVSVSEEEEETACLIVNPTTNNVVNVTSDIKQITAELIQTESEAHTETDSVVVVNENKIDIENKDEMSTSMIKTRINTEEEAKAALAERRRIAREEAEQKAEQERLRIEREEREELERQRREEEQVQMLVEQQRMQEQARLEEAIKETQKREEEERLRREEEQRQKELKEEADKKAREEAEKKMAEQQERLKNEEKEREARRKRVEAIMRRTRGVNNSNAPGQQNSEDNNENKSENKMNGTKVVEQENGTKNGKDVDIVDNIIPDDTVKNANTVSIDTISTDSINSNNTWQSTQPFDPLM